MHIAVCDDNVADRKQFERLLKREADKRYNTSEVLYFDSFGNKEALLHNPMQYDVFYLDICHTEGVSTAEVVATMRERGIKAPIVLCCSDINYREYDFGDDISFLDKPIKVPELSESIEQAIAIKNTAPSLIELRCSEDTYYVTEPEIMYGVQTDRFVVVTMSDGRQINVISTVKNLFAEIEHNPLFVKLTNKVLANSRYIKSIRGTKINMSDGSSFNADIRLLSKIKKTMKTNL